MSIHLAEFVRANRADVELAWLRYIDALGSAAYDALPAQEKELRVAACTGAFLTLLEEGSDAELRAIVEEIVQRRMPHGFPLRDLQRAMLGFREAILPQLVRGRSPESLLEILAELHHCTDTVLSLITDSYRQVVLGEIRQLGSLLLEEEVELRSLRQANQFKTEFVSNVSHELRNPLAAIMGYAKMMIRRQAGDLTPIQEEFLGIIDRNASRLLNLVNDLLDISRIEAGKLELRHEMFDMGAVVNSVTQSLRAAADARRVTLNTHITPGVPHVFGDAERVAQVVSNLVSNAVKYGAADAPVDIYVETAPPTPPSRGGPHAADPAAAPLGGLPAGDAHVIVRVVDRGDGIRPDEHARLFRKFSRLENAATQRAEGTGLGLAIAKHLVEMHGGHIWVDSGPKKGTVFCFSLPVAGKNPLNA